MYLFNWSSSISKGLLLRVDGRGFLLSGFRAPRRFTPRNILEYGVKNQLNESLKYNWCFTEFGGSQDALRPHANRCSHERP